MNSRIKNFVFAFVLAFGLLFIAVHFSMLVQADDLKAVEWTMRVDDGKGNAGEEVDSFVPSDHKIHFQVDLSGDVAKGDKIKFSFTAVDTDAGRT